MLPILLLAGSVVASISGSAMENRSRSRFLISKRNLESSVPSECKAIYTAEEKLVKAKKVFLQAFETALTSLITAEEGVYKKKVGVNVSILCSCPDPDDSAYGSTYSKLKESMEKLFTTEGLILFSQIETSLKKKYEVELEEYFAQCAPKTTCAPDPPSDPPTQNPTPVPPPSMPTTAGPTTSDPTATINTFAPTPVNKTTTVQATFPPTPATPQPTPKTWEPTENPTTVQPTKEPVTTSPPPNAFPTPPPTLPPNPFPTPPLPPTPPPTGTLPPNPFPTPPLPPTTLPPNPFPTPPLPPTPPPTLPPNPFPTPPLPPTPPPTGTLPPNPYPTPFVTPCPPQDQAVVPCITPCPQDTNAPPVKSAINVLLQGGRKLEILSGDGESQRKSWGSVFISV